MGAKLVSSDGHVHDLYFDSEPTLDQLQELVGGYIQVLPVHDDNQYIVNEDGHLMRLPYNGLASSLLPQYEIVGPMVVLTNNTRMT